MSFSIFSGFGATPSKPDFAYPKTVSKTAEAELKTALKKQNGPAAVRAMLDYGLAQTAINPDKVDEITEYFGKVSDQLKSPAAKAMIMLIRGDMQNEDSLYIKAIENYGDALKSTPTAEWKSVIEADELFFPTLYDFAVALTADDNIREAAIAYDADRPYPLIYLELNRSQDFDKIKDIYIKTLDSPTNGYAMLTMAARARTFEQRKEAYKLIKGRSGDDAAKAVAELTSPSISCRTNSIIALGKTLEINISAICLNAATLIVEMDKPTNKKVKTIDLHFDGEGVFRADTAVQLSFNEYGVYKIKPIYNGYNSSDGYSNEAVVTVTDFLLAKPRYGAEKLTAYALDDINGAPQSDVKISTIKDYLYGSRGNDIYSPKLWSYEGRNMDTEVRKSANILTDRAIYKPGETLRFAATLMEAKGRSRKLLSGNMVRVILKNVNWQDVASLELTSDDFGRINGEFRLPNDGLTGRYTVEVQDFSSKAVMVTDYKAPTFEVEIKADRIDSTTVELRGKAAAYSGFPISNAQVALSIDKLPEWVWFRNFDTIDETDIATDTIKTDATGNFTARLTVPEGVNLRAEAVVTSVSGESRDASAFIPFYRYCIEGNTPPFIEAGKGPKFRVIDAEGKVCDIDVKVTLNDSIIPDNTWSDIRSGEYKVKVLATDAASVEFTTTVYRPDDKMPPTETALFLPVTTAKPGDKLIVGTSYADSHILMTIWTPDSIIEQKWLTPEIGNFFIDVELPEGVNDAVMTLFTMRNYHTTEHTVKITRPDVARNLNLEISSLRNKMLPGESETWTIKVTDNLGKPVMAAVMADAYCKALDALQPFRWDFNPIRLYGNSFDISARSGGIAHADCETNGTLRSPLENIMAGFNLRQQSWPVLLRGRYYSYAAMDMKAPMMSKGMLMTSNTMDEFDEEVAVEATADTGATEDTGTPTQTSDEYRLPEVAVALWQPVLTTEADGSLEIRFTAPNANTTWAVNALAYNKELLSGLAAAEIVTSKPLMVQPQWPRFMRVGDELEFRATVMNNTEESTTVNSVIELFNPATGENISTTVFSNDLDGMTSAVISLPITAPDASMIGVRVCATAGNFTDGEQSIIAILPNQVDVRTGKPIFVAADSTEISVDIPRGGIMTFTANAVWECVSALPGLMATGSNSALSAAGALFSAATARGLMRRHPEIGRALHVWEQEDSALISAIMKNEDLKIALLESTPFVSAAQSESDQRARLLLLFNNKEIDKVINSAIATLKKLKRDGGLAWTQNCKEPSFRITQSVLNSIAQLRRSGYMPKSGELDKIISDAVTYLDTEVAKIYAKNKDARFADYVMLRKQFPEVRLSAPAKRAAEATVQYLVGHWRELPLSGIAKAAIILYENNYPTTSRELIESLRQHEAWAQLPLSPILLEAFARVEPTCAEVDQIRADYISRKQSMDWGACPDVSMLVASILNSGAEWLIPAANELNVKINGERANVNAEPVSGELRLNLPEGGKVEITKGKFPAWGGIFSAAVDSISKVEPFSSEQLKLTRTIEGKMAVGEKITVKLTLEASQDMDYVIVRQPHCAGMEVVNQLPSTLWLGWLSAYCEPTATCTNWYFNRLAKGTTEISQTFYITAQGSFSLAPAEAQSQYAPEFQSHTAGTEFTITQ